MGLRIEVVVNNHKGEIPAGFTVRYVVAHPRLDPQCAAAGLNCTIVGKANWNALSV